MGNLNIGGSWMDEFYKIAEEKGWIVKEAISHSEVENVWGNLDDGKKSELIPGWEGMTFSDLVDKIELKWGPILMAFRAQSVPQGEVSVGPPTLKTQPQKQISPELISKVQGLAMKHTGIPVSNPQGRFRGQPDGQWGKRSAYAWNQFIEKYTTPGGPLVVNPVNESGNELPRMEDIRYVFQNPPSAKKPVEPPTGPSKEIEKDILEKRKEKGLPTPTWMADDMVSTAKDPYAEMAEQMPELSPQQMRELIRPNVPTSEEVLQKMRGEGLPGDIVVEPTDWRSKYRGIKGIPADVKEYEHLATMKLLRQQGHSGMIKDRSVYMDALNQVRSRTKSKEDFVPKTPEWAKADDVVASVVNELTSLASGLDELGEMRAASMIDNQTKFYVEAAQKLYDITGETGEQLINQAHPGGGPTLAPAAEEGGKVETIVEEHKKIVDKVKKQPTGKYAETMMKLIATANKLEESGEVEAAKIVDKTISELREVPFVNRSLAVEATNSEDKNASIKLAEKKYSKLIPMWDNIINIKFNKLYEEIMEYSFIKDLTQLAKPRTLMKKYATANELISYVSKIWHFAPSEKIAEQIEKIAKVLNLGDATYKNMIAIISKENVEYYTKLHNSMVKDFYNLANKFKTLTEKVSPEKVEKELGKTERKDLNPLQVRNIKEYLSLLKKLETVMVQNSTKVHKVLNNSNAIMKWIKDKKYNITNPKTKFKYTPGGKEVEKLKNFVDKLEKKMAKTASFKIEGQGSAVPGGAFKEEPKKKVVEKTPKRHRPPKDLEIIKLQEALQKAKHSPGKIDGWWGPKTAAAWNAFLAKAPVGVEKFMKKIPNPQGQRHKHKPSSGVLRTVTYIVNYITNRKQQKGTSFIELADGIKIPIRVLSNSATFADFMQRSLRSRSFPPSSALQYLNELLQHVDDNEYNMEAKAHGSAQKWRDRIEILMREFQGYVAQEKEDAAAGKTFSYPWGRGGAGRAPGYGGAPGRLEFPRGRGAVPGSQDAGIKGLSYPALDRPENITLAIRMLPDQSWLSSIRNFTSKAEADMNVKGAPREQATTRAGRVKQYWKFLSDRVRDIISAMTVHKEEILARNPSVYREMIDRITSFNNELEWVGEQLGIAQ